MPDFAASSSYSCSKRVRGVSPQAWALGNDVCAEESTGKWQVQNDCVIDVFLRVSYYLNVLSTYISIVTYYKDSLFSSIVKWIVRMKLTFRAKRNGILQRS